MSSVNETSWANWILAFQGVRKSDVVARDWKLLELIHLDPLEERSRNSLTEGLETLRLLPSLELAI